MIQVLSYTLFQPWRCACGAIVRAHEPHGAEQGCASPAIVQDAALDTPQVMTCSTGYCNCAAKDQRIRDLEAENGKLKRMALCACVDVIAEAEKTQGHNFVQDAIRMKMRIRDLEASLAQSEAKLDTATSERRGLLGLVRAALVDITGTADKPMLDMVASVKDKLARAEDERERLKNDAGLFHEVVNRLRGAFIVAHLGEWTEWQAAIDLFLKAAQAQVDDKARERAEKAERDLVDARAHLDSVAAAFGIQKGQTYLPQQLGEMVAETRKDTARIDWMQSREAVVRFSCINGFHVIGWDQEAGRCMDGTGKDLRAAIDDAQGSPNA